MTLVNQFHTQLQVTSEVTNKILEYLSTGSDRAKEQARLTFIDEFDPEVSKLEGILDQFSDQVTDLVDNSYNSSMETRNILFIVGIIIVIVALIHYYGNDPDTFRSRAGKTVAGSYGKNETRRYGY